MKSYAQTLLQVGFVALICGFIAVWQHQNNDWDFIVYTQQWPQASCVDINATHHEKCFLPSNVKTWTIHGIWPSREQNKGPFYCNDSWPFRESAIMDLEPQLVNRWPNLIDGEGKTSFWKHEWVKHGTCAAILPALDSEHNYFAKGLELNKRFDYMRILADKNITPSKDAQYKISDIRDAIEGFTNSYTIIQCLMSKDKSVQAIVQVEVCLNKDFTTRDCVDYDKASVYSGPSWDHIPYNPSFEKCDADLPTQYLPFTYASRPRR
uniref:Uncharacterized protein n=1 Tax=Ciona savignyi TaxID=51511 RepID=H2Z178_CIOSA